MYEYARARVRDILKTKIRVKIMRLERTGGLHFFFPSLCPLYQIIHKVMSTSAETSINVDRSEHIEASSGDGNEQAGASIVCGDPSRRSMMDRISQ